MDVEIVHIVILAKSMIINKALEEVSNGTKIFTRNVNRTIWRENNK